MYSLSRMKPPTAAPGYTLGKHRLEALSDGIYAIALTLLVLELKLPALPPGVNDAALRGALLDLLPKALTWLLSFWVMAMFWLAQFRLYRLSLVLDWSMVWIELMQLALISLLPFSTALIGEHGDLTTAAALYSLHLLAISVLSWARTLHVLAHAELHSADLSPAVATVLRVRAWVLVVCAMATLVLAFFIPGWNMLAMLPTALMPVFARL